jgi:hypothetical protein
MLGKVVFSAVSMKVPVNVGSHARIAAMNREGTRKRLSIMDVSWYSGNETEGCLNHMEDTSFYIP